MVNHGKQELTRSFCPGRTDAFQRSVDTGGLQAGQLCDKGLAFGRGEKKTLPAVRIPSLLDNIAFVQKLLEDPPQRLLGDPEHIQQVGDLQPWIAGHEVDYPVVSPAEAEFLQNMVGIADKVPIGEKQKLNDVPPLVSGCRGSRSSAFRGGLPCAWRVEIYVSHVDIFRVQCYKKTKLHEIFGYFVTCGPLEARKPQSLASSKVNFFAVRLSIDIPRNILDLTAHVKQRAHRRL